MGGAGRLALLVAEGEVPLLRDGRFAKRPYDGVGGSWGGDGVLGWGLPARRRPSGFLPSQE